MFSLHGLRQWLPILGLSFAAFVFNTSEFLPVGLLPDMAQDLGESVSFMGLIITGYAGLVTVISLPLALLTAHMDRRRLLLFLLALFAVCHFAVIWVESFASLFTARIGVAAAQSLFWSIMTPLAARMSPPGKAAVGLALVTGGTIVAMVLGVPLGTKLGHVLGWNQAFVVLGVCALLVLPILFWLLPPCPSTRAGSLKSLPVILRRPALLELYAVVLVAVAGQFTAYSYMNPILEHLGGLDADGIVRSLLAYGLAGIVGSFVGAKVVGRFPSGALLVPLLILAISLFALVPICGTWGLTPLLIVWGASFTALGLAFQTVLLRAAADCADIATSIFSSIFNVGIGGGALIGSLVSAKWGFVPIAPLASCLFVVALAILACVFFRTGNAILPHPDFSHHGEPLTAVPDENGDKRH